MGVALDVHKVDEGSVPVHTRKTKFTPVDAAEMALATQAIVLAATRLRVVQAASAMGCRDLQRPTVRRFTEELERTSLSTPLAAFADAPGQLNRRPVHRALAAVASGWSEETAVQE